LRAAHKTQDVGQIDSAMTALNTAWTAASEEMYKATQGAQPGAETNGSQQDGQQQGSNAGSETVTDAEYEEVK